MGLTSLLGWARTSGWGSRQWRAYLCGMKSSLRLLFSLLLLLAAVSCRTCPIESCHVRKVHLHSGVKYRGQPLWKKQNPAIGEKIKLSSDKQGAHAQDKSKPLK